MGVGRPELLGMFADGQLVLLPEKHHGGNSGGYP